MPLIKAAIEHEGAAFIDVISPCVAFNNHAGSTKSFDYVREHNEAVNRLDFITGRAPITVAYEPGAVEVVEQHDGSKLVLKKVAADYDPHDRVGAMTLPAAARRHGAGRDRAALRRPRARGPAPAFQYRRRAAQRAVGEGAVPRLGGARQNQRQPALMGGQRRPRNCRWSELRLRAFAHAFAR